MKFPKIIILFIAVLSFMTSSAQVVQNTFSSLNFKGKIKTLKESIFSGEMVSGEFQKLKTIQVDITQFDINGKKTDLEIIGSDDNSLGQTKYIYNPKGLLTEGYFTSSRSIGYSKFRAARPNYTQNTFIYDDKDNNIEQNSLRSDGSILSKSIIKYDDLGKMTEKNDYDGNYRLKSIYSYKYDAKGNKILETQYSEGKFIDSTNWKYDETNNIMEENHFYSIPKFNRNYIYKYELDEAGNWITQLRFAKGWPTILTERKIKYYKE